MASSIELTRIRPEFALFLTEEPPGSRSPIDVGDIFPQSLSNDETTLVAIHPPWKRNLFALLEQPKSSKSAFLVHMVTTSLILISAVVTVLETVPTLHTISTGAWFGVETSLVALFTVEYIARCLAWSGSWMSLLRWQTSFFGIIDLLSVAPYYIEILLHQDTSVLFRFSILRMFRLLRVFKPFRYNNTILLTIEVITLLYFAERGTWDPLLDTFVNADGDPTQFSSIPAAAWFVLVTITTVGYGEITPRSFLGRLITIPILMFGLLLITLPSFVLGREFSIVWEKMTAKRHKDQHETNSPVEYTFPNLGLPSPGLPPRERDLTNHKLAQNQTELSRQISDLRATVEMQGRTLERLLDVMEGSFSKGKGVDRT
ncbi:Potassium voltage-gated channel subfamily D member 3 [Hypsizygus marmoreus]|uniref:Potassium voltage-gated channel subfamily D member 3 n=1 Tax=Hypsizygus marmoreus TaxID=39966 RepID=A0A369KF30_HYPMA|nr:Potassium voltage-gated channel subfamily D member 3 [Hypsizygus marmoreus]